MERRVSTEMKKLTISRVILPRVIGRRSWCTRVNIPCCGAHFSRIHAPIVINFKNAIVSTIIATGNLYLHFKEINKTSNDKRNEDVFPVRCVQIDNFNHHAEHAQYNCMAPQKTHGLDGVIKNLLYPMNSSYLHYVFVISFHRITIPFKFLKIYLFGEEKSGFCVYSDENPLFIKKVKNVI